ncbi:TIGR02646 family protein [Pseudoalteromonas sp. J010]|uniref:retron system putative HNH endonuclease n=1 Tax=Pseudoalteromonas sp. J010 TaxID=998465 RepID=UPI000F64D27F|nr:retron system putative HNH endonuclease [Pseudoalteromonas sp. J010]RRS09181.1 TIGR02646 family protein [Pseudoalteromonas sp. J010]
MRQITKNVQPNSLTTYKNDVDAAYGNLPQMVRDDLKQSLLNEQGYVCAYCMSRIKENAMRIEHWACQDDNDELALEYSNLLACCTGNEGKDKTTYTCDKKKANDPLKFSPANPYHNINSRIFYHEGGVVKSNDKTFDQELNNILNLNETRLRQNRVFALEAVQELLNAKRGTRSKSQIQSLLDNVMAVNQKNQHKPYFGFLADYLQKKL